MWQVSSAISPMNGPFDAVLLWLIPTSANAATMIPTIAATVVIIIVLAILLFLLAVRIHSQLDWNRALQELVRYTSYTEEDQQGIFPQQGVELTSLPFIQQYTQDFEPRGIKQRTANSGPYIFAPFAALHNVIKTATFEVDIGSSISIRFWVPRKNGKTLDELEILSSSLQTSYSNIEFRRVSPAVIPQILGSPTTEAKIVGEYIRFTSELVSVIHIKGIPGASLGETQLDKLIHTLNEREIEGSFIVNFSSTKTPQKEQIKPAKPSHWDYEFEWNPTRKQERERDEEGLGYWSVSAYMVIRSSDEETHLSKVNIAKTILETTFLNTENPLRTKILKGNTLRKMLRRILQRKSVGKTEIMSSRELSILVHLPRHAQPGYLRKHTAEFELPPRRKSQIDLFKAMKGKRVLYPVGIDLEHLTTHMIVAGQTGKGKTRFVANLIKQIKNHTDVGITIFDWKGEYRGIIDTVYRIGLEECPLKINLFEVHGKGNIQEYVRNIISLLRELLRSNTETDISPQMERIFRESLTDYLKRGKGNYEEYERFLTRWIHKHGRDYSRPDASVAGLINRFGSLFRGRLGWIFNTSGTSIDFEELIKNHACFDLSNLSAYNKDDARLFANILLMLIRTYLFRSFSEKLRYLVIAEEAQYLVPEIFSKRSTADASPAEDITLFQRAYGAGLITITTRPNLISRNILANSGIKVFFQCPLDSNIVGDILNLNLEQRQFLTLMPERVVIAHLPWFEHPFKAKTQECEMPAIQGHPIASDNVPLLAPQSTTMLETCRMENYSQHSQPVIRHFLNLACTALFEQDVLHRIAKYDIHTVIDIPRHRVLLFFLNEPDDLDRLKLHNLEKITSDIVIICPPRQKAVFKEALTRFRTRVNAECIELRVFTITLTFSEMQRLAKSIKENQLSTIEKELYHQKDATSPREGSDQIEYAKIGQVVKSWRRIEQVFQEALRRRRIQTRDTERTKYTTLLKALGLARWISEFEWLRKTRNRIIHNEAHLNKALVQNYCRRAENLLALITQSLEKQAASNTPFTH
ncbi:MAG: ATP-binding protein [Promethearchaeota archaeon]